MATNSSDANAAPSASATRSCDAVLGTMRQVPTFFDATAKDKDRNQLSDAAATFKDRNQVSLMLQPPSKIGTKLSLMLQPSSSSHNCGHQVDPRSVFAEPPEGVRGQSGAVSATCGGDGAPGRNRPGFGRMKPRHGRLFVLVEL